MRKTTVYLTEDEAEALRSASIATGKSQSELIREGVRHVTASRPKRVFHSMGIGGSKNTDYEGLVLEYDLEDLYEHKMGRPLPKRRDADR